MPANNVSYGPGPFLTSGNDRRRSEEIFREVDGHSEESHSPVPPDFDDLAALVRLDVDNETNWVIEDLVASRPLDSDKSVAMNALNFKRRDEGLSPVKTFKDFIYIYGACSD